jgi:large subunit ribosomal protein L20
MPRAKRGTRGARRRKSVLKQAKGFYGARSRLIRTALESVDNALKSAYVGRKLKKRDFRGLWQTRIAAAAKENGTSYSRLIGALNKKEAKLNRKVLSEVAIQHPEDFKAIVAWAAN